MANVYGIVEDIVTGIIKDTIPITKITKKGQKNF
jgi:hypothetical protein